MTDFSSFSSSILAGIPRCMSVDRLERYYRDWREEIDVDGKKGEIIQAFRQRKEELIAGGVKDGKTGKDHPVSRSKNR